MAGVLAAVIGIALAALDSSNGEPGTIALMGAAMVVIGILLFLTS